MRSSSAASFLVSADSDVSRNPFQAIQRAVSGNEINNSLQLQD